MGVDLLSSGLLATAVHWGGRKLKGKSRRELRGLGLIVPGTDADPATQTERR
jgi:hypothetical protein